MKPRYALASGKMPFHRVQVGGLFTSLSPMFRPYSVFLKLDTSHAAPYPPGTVDLIFASREPVMLVERRVKRITEAG